MGYLYDRFSRGSAFTGFAYLGSHYLVERDRPFVQHFSGDARIHGSGRFQLSGPLQSDRGLFLTGKARKDLRLLQLTQPLGYMAGLIPRDHLRSYSRLAKRIFLTGALGVVLAIVIFFTVKDIPAGTSEPEFESIEGSR